MIAGLAWLPRPVAGAAVAASLLLTGCSQGAADGGAELRVATTTGIIADLVRHVGGDRVAVESVVPHAGDPHSYEPTPRDAARIGRADVVFSNGMLLEEQSITKLVASNAGKDVPKVALAEEVEAHGGSLIPLEEDLGLDVLWLGLAVTGDARAGAAGVRLTATALDGPGDLFVYLTDALGQPERYLDSSDGFDARDTMSLPAGAHTHVNWAFTKPGVYRLTLAAASDDPARRPLGTSTFTFVVQTPPPAGTVLDKGHADLAVDPAGGLAVRSADHGMLPADRTVLVVPAAAKVPVPAGSRYAFLGRAKAPVWVLPQAVLGKHVHGEIDPHLWQDVANAQAYVRIVLATLNRVDPAGRATYQRNATAYLAELAALDGQVRARLATIPAAHRQLITTHDAFGYLAKAYGLTVVGFVVPNPGQEPSAAEVSTLTKTIEKLEVPAVFVEPNLAARAEVLRRVADDQDVRLCVLYGDAFDDKVTDYTGMMRHNADELARCLGSAR